VVRGPSADRRRRTRREEHAAVGPLPGAKWSLGFPVGGSAGPTRSSPRPRRPVAKTSRTADGGWRNGTPSLGQPAHAAGEGHPAVWQHRHRPGIVRSSGALRVPMATRPTHPELLDWLAGPSSATPGWGNETDAHRAGSSSCGCSASAYHMSLVQGPPPALGAADPRNDLFSRGVDMRPGGPRRSATAILLRPRRQRHTPNITIKVRARRLPATPT
jgi:hypothetical protein